jgi:uncharacterized protein (TIGR00661 family)
MVRIIYGVCGEGNGHSTRSNEIINHLIKKGHKVIVFAYGKSYSNLKDKFKCYDTKGMHFAYEDNKVHYGKTVLENLKKSPEMLRRIFMLSKTFTDFNPDIVFSDFEATTSFLAKIHFKPLISIDNQHMITNAKLCVPLKYKRNYMLTKAAIKVISQKADEYLITTFFKEKSIKKNTHFIAPILRQKVFDKISKKKDYVLVYQTSDSNKKLVLILKKIKEKFIVYGFNKDEKTKNIIFKKFCEDTFLNDLALSKAAILNGGLTVITECLYFGKPILSQPVKNQFEQALNALYLEKLGYGQFQEDLSLAKIKNFLSNLKKYETNLKQYPYKDNKQTFNMVDALVRKYSKKK